jgi:hypothetical protein
MAANPRTVAVETWITWDGVPTRLPKGQAIDVTPGSALERAIGRERLVPLGPTSALPPAEEPAPPEEPAPARPRATAKSSDAKDGGR